MVIFYLFLSYCTEVIEIQGENHSKSMAPPPTAQTPGPNWLIFWLENPLVNAFRGIALRRFLNFILEAEIWAHLGAFLGVELGSKNSWFSAYLGS